LLKQHIHTYAKAFINSYAQLFFADHKIFAWLLLLSTYVNPITGLSGSLATIFALLFARWIGLNKEITQSGVYSYNALMSGLVLGSQYQLNWPFFVVLLIAALISVMLTVWFNNMLFKYNLPSLSIGFLLTLWIITLALKGFNEIEYSQQGIFRLNEWYKLGGLNMVDYLNWLEHNSLPEFISVYLKSISAVFFQYNILSGLLISIGLIIWSRIGFLLSVIGFTVGYMFFYFVSGEFTQLYYSYIGFNFILTAIAIGGFYLVPSGASFLLAILTMPVIGILISALNNFMYLWQLPIYSLPFVITVMLILLLLSNRTAFNQLIPVSLQLFSPEKNLYHYLNLVQRFKNNKAISLQLPFYGEWLVSQGYEGKITHKSEWKHALDFVVVDETKHTYKLPGKNVTDYYCYGLPVLAPAAGYVVAIIDGVEENEIGKIDIENNWGNTIVIKHSEGFYSKLAHLKTNSITVRQGDYVAKGAIIAYCGSSGRSPEPHLHFQLQLTPYVGSATFPYPLSYFITRQQNNYLLNEYTVPQEGQLVHYPIKTPMLAAAFNFIPGQKLKFEVHSPSQQKTQLITWECGVNSYNQTYLRCPQSNAYAYFVNNGTVLYFTNYYGNKNALLYHFYIAFYKILLGYYQQLKINDNLPVTAFNYNASLLMHDFVAPFYNFMQVQYQSEFVYLDNVITPTEIHIQSAVYIKKGLSLTTKMHYHIQIKNQYIANWQLINDNIPQLTFTCLENTY